MTADRIKALEDALARALSAWDEHNERGHAMQGDWVYDARAALAASRAASDCQQPDLVTAARVLLADHAAVAALARAYDREDSAQRGEADPHDTSLFPVDDEWRAERAACAIAGLRAIAGGDA